MSEFMDWFRAEQEAFFERHPRRRFSGDTPVRGGAIYRGACDPVQDATGQPDISECSADDAARQPGANHCGGNMPAIPDEKVEVFEHKAECLAPFMLPGCPMKVLKLYMPGEEYEFEMQLPLVDMRGFAGHERQA